MTNTIKFQKFTRVDCGTDEQDIKDGEAFIGSIIKSYAQPVGALGLVDSRGLVESYAVEIWGGKDTPDDFGGERFFDVANYPSARAALKAAKAWAVETAKAL